MTKAELLAARFETEGELLDLGRGILSAIIYFATYEEKKEQKRKQQEYRNTLSSTEGILYDLKEVNKACLAKIYR